MNRILLVGIASITISAQPALARQDRAAGDGTLAALLDSIRTADSLPALAGMVMHGDSILELAAVGVRASGGDVAVTTRDRWHIGSNTKAMTATLAGVLVERGLIDWSTTVADVFPELVDSIRPEIVDVTLSELFGHTAGVSNAVFQTPSWRTVRQSTAPLPEQRLTWIRELMSLEPTERGTFSYSNSGYIVAGAMLERLTGTSWEELIRREIFESLGMASAGFGAPGSPDTVDEPRGHNRVRGTPRAVEPGPFADNPAALGPAGTVHVSMPDFARWVSAHLAGARGTPGLVRAETFAALHTPLAGEAGYALGWIVGHRPWAGGTILGHNGSNTLWYHAVVLVPEKNYAVVVATNIGSERAVNGTIRKLVDRAQIWLDHNGGAGAR